MRLLFFMALVVLMNTAVSAPLVIAGVDYTTQQQQLSTLQLGSNGALLKQALKETQMLLEERPNDPLIAMYLGAFTCIEARDSWNIFTKKSTVTKGLSMMDAIVVDRYANNSPLYLRLLMVRGITNSNIPSSFNRSAVGLADLQAVLHHADFTSLTQDDKTYIYVALSVAYGYQKDTKDSATYKEMALAENASLAKKLLAL